MIRSAYRAAEGFAAPLGEELALSGRRVEGWCGDLALSPDPPAPAAWALDVWTAPRTIAFGSIKEGADALRALQRNWSHVPARHHRRSALLAERLPPVKQRPMAFPEAAPVAHLGAWTLLEPGLMLASPTKTSPFPLSAPLFLEDREGPPSRAYLKLWEGLTRIGAHPQPGERCLDLGASPGGWSWAIAKLGAEVVAVDKAPLEESVAAMPGVSWRQASAFGLGPDGEPAFDWVFSDVICYPERLLGLVRRWRAAGKARRVFCSIKFQGATDHAATAAFAALPGALVFHSAHNKHELTCVIQD